MRFQPWRLVLLFAPLLAVAACATGTARVTQNLYDRMSVRLASDIKAGRATLQPMPSGVGVTLAGDALFTPGGSDLNDAGRDVLTGVIQALLDPSLLHIEVAQAPATPASLQAARVQAVAQYINQPNAAPFIQVSVPAQPPPPGPAGAAAPGPTVTVNVTSS